MGCHACNGEIWQDETGTWFHVEDDPDYVSWIFGPHIVVASSWNDATNSYNFH